MPITIVRWILVPFAAWLAWGAAVLVGFELEALASYLCPKDQMVSDMCTAPWYGVALTSISGGACIIEVTNIHDHQKHS